MRHTQRSVSDFPGLFSKNGPQESFLGGKLSFPFWGNFANQDVVWADGGTDSNSAVFTQVSKIGFGDVWNISGQFFGTKLGIHDIASVLVDVNRRK